jgi:hypothetical protein
LSTQPIQVEISEIHPIQRDSALVGVVEAHHQLENSGLPAPRLPHEG